MPLETLLKLARTLSARIRMEYKSTVNTSRSADIRGVGIMIIVMAAMLLVCAAFGFWKEQINDALNALAAEWNVGFHESSNLILGFVFVGIVMIANLFWLPTALVSPWALLALAGMCLLTGIGTIYYSMSVKREGL